MARSTTNAGPAGDAANATPGPAVTGSEATGTRTDGSAAASDDAAGTKTDSQDLEADTAAFNDDAVGTTLDVSEATGEVSLVTPPVSAGAASGNSDAQRVAEEDRRLRAANPNAVITRVAGTSGEIGGENFRYGHKPEKNGESE